MNPKFIIAFVVVVAASQVDGACLCNFGEGKDMCHSATGPSKSCAPLVIRPARLPKLTLEDVFKPRVVCKTISTGLKPMSAIGDLCDCKQSIVTPAFVPRPSCAKCSTNSQAQFDESSIFSNSQAAHSQNTIYVQNAPAQSDYVEVPYAADPVSLSLAYQAQHKSCGAHEDRLAFGFQKLPVDGSRVIMKQVKPESNIHSWNGKVVELKPIPCSTANRRTIDDEAYEQMMMEAESESEAQVDASQPKRLSYTDIGFAPELDKSPTFIIQAQGSGNMQQVEQISNSGDSYDSGASCDDGFMPGQLTIRNIPRKEVYSPGQTPPADCGDDESFPMKYVTYQSKTHHTNERVHHRRTSSSSSSSSCNN